jgi:hypothetical protein
MFTLAEGFMLGCVTATYDVNEVGAKSAHHNFSQCYYGIPCFLLVRGPVFLKLFLDKKSIKYTEEIFLHQNVLHIRPL